jgi:hypothetical protein
VRRTSRADSGLADESHAFELFRDGTAGLAYLLIDRIGDLSRGSPPC